MYRQINFDYTHHTHTPKVLTFNECHGTAGILAIIVIVIDYWIYMVMF